MIISLLIIPVVITGSFTTGIPFSGNHSYDQLQGMISQVPDTSDYLAKYQVGLNTTPSNITHAIYLGKVAFKAGNLSEAEREFSFATNFSQNSKEAWRGLLLSLTLQEKYDELLNKSNERLNLSPYDEYIWLDKAWAHANRDEYESALNAFKKVSELNSRNIFSPYYSAWTYNNMGQYQNAVKSFEKVALLSPQYGGTEGNIGFLLIPQERYEEAIVHLDRALLWYPNWTEAQRAKGIALYNLNKTDEALNIWDSVISRDVNFTHIYLTKGEALEDQNRFEEAAETIDQGLSVDPNSTELLVLKGDILTGLKRYDEALKSYERVIELNETGYNLYYALWGKGYLSDKLGKKEEAQSAYKNSLNKVNEALEKYSQSSRLWHLKGEIFEGIGRSRDARVAYNKAEELKYEKYIYI